MERDSDIDIDRGLDIDKEGYLDVYKRYIYHLAHWQLSNDGHEPMRVEGAAPLVAE